MELMVRNGDYVPDEAGGFRRAEGNDALLQRVLWKLAIPRGSFPLLPELGSELYRLGRVRPSQRDSLAQQYAVQALADEPGISVTGATLSEDGSLRVELDWSGQTLAVTLETEGI